MRPLLRGVAHVSRRFHPRGTERMLRALHPPDDRSWSVQDVVRLPDGALVHLDTASWVEWRAFFFGEYEPELTAVLGRHLRAGDVAIDVGANIGLHSLTMAGLVGPTGRVIACEPNPSVATSLRNNVGLNREREVTVLEVAVSDRDGPVELAAPSNSDPNQGRATLARARGEGWSRISVRGTTIDSLIGDLSLKSVALIKVDVEGFEAAVIRGASTVLQRHRPALVFEYSRSYWREAGASLAAIWENLTDHGYVRLYSISRRDMQPLGADPPDCEVLALPA
jgi:FkbM family methyltransferase